MHCAAHQTNLSAGHGKGNRDVTVLERWVIRVVARRSRVRPCWLLLAGQQGCGLEKKQPKKQRAWGRRSVHHSSLDCGESPATAQLLVASQLDSQLSSAATCRQVQHANTLPSLPPQAPRAAPRGRRSQPHAA